MAVSISHEFALADHAPEFDDCLQTVEVTQMGNPQSERWAKINCIAIAHVHHTCMHSPTCIQNQ